MTTADAMWTDQIPQAAMQQLRAAGRCLASCVVRGRTSPAALGFDVFISHNGMEYRSTFTDPHGGNAWDNVVAWFGEQIRYEHPASIVADLAPPKRVPTHEDVMAAIAILDLVRCDEDGFAHAVNDLAAIRRAWYASLDVGEADDATVSR